MTRPGRDSIVSGILLDQNSLSGHEAGRDRASSRQPTTATETEEVVQHFVASSLLSKKLANANLDVPGVSCAAAIGRHMHGHLTRRADAPLSPISDILFAHWRKCLVLAGDWSCGAHPRSASLRRTLHASSPRIG